MGASLKWEMDGYCSFQLQHGTLTVLYISFPGPLWIVLVADADGFVPLTFKPKDELTVRNGKRKSTLRTPGSPENSCPSSPAPSQSPTTTAEASV